MNSVQIGKRFEARVNVSDLLRQPLAIYAESEVLFNAPRNLFRNLADRLATQVLAGAEVEFRIQRLKQPLDRTQIGQWV